MLDPAGHATEVPVRVPRKVADGHERCEGRVHLHRTVGEEAVRQIKIVATKPLGVRDRADRLDDDVGRKLGAVAERDRAHPIGTCE